MVAFEESQKLKPDSVATSITSEPVLPRLDTGRRECTLGVFSSLTVTWAIISYFEIEPIVDNSKTVFIRAILGNITHLPTLYTVCCYSISTNLFSFTLVYISNSYSTRHSSSDIVSALWLLFKLSGFLVLGCGFNVKCFIKSMTISIHIFH